MREEPRREGHVELGVGHGGREEARAGKRELLVQRLQSFGARGRAGRLLQQQP